MFLSVSYLYLITFLFVQSIFILCECYLVKSALEKISSLKSINLEANLNENKNNKTEEEIIGEGEAINSNINEQNDNNIEGKTQEFMVNINSIPNINPKIDLNKNQNKNKNNKTEEEIMYEGIVIDQKNFPKQNIPNKITEEKIIVSDNNNSINQEKQNRPASNLFKAKILHNPLMIAIGFIILSILFGVIGFAAKITLLYIIGAAVLFIGIVFLLAWSIKKYRKKSNDIRKINVMPDDNYQKEDTTKENIKSEDRSNESEINTKSPTLISQEFGKE